MMRFSSAWEMPTPLRPPIALASIISPLVLSALPLMDTQRPALKAITTSSILSGAAEGHTPISGSTMSMGVCTLSRSSASCDSPARLASVLYFFLGPTKASIPNLLRYAAISLRPGNSSRRSASRQGAYTSILGARTFVYRSKRIWSLPRPVAPWASTSTLFSTIAWIRPRQVTYRPMPVVFQ